MKKGHLAKKTIQREYNIANQRLNDDFMIDLDAWCDSDLVEILGLAQRLHQARKKGADRWSEANPKEEGD